MSQLPTTVGKPTGYSQEESPGQVAAKPATPGEVPASGGGLWRPKSSRQGIGPLRYVWWNSLYAIMEFFNRALARDPNRKVSWDKWPPILGFFI